MKYGRASQIVNSASKVIAPQKISPSLMTKEEFDEYDSTIRDMLKKKQQLFYELSYELYEDLPPDHELTYNEQKKRMAESQKLFQQLVDGMKNGSIKKAD